MPQLARFFSGFFTHSIHRLSLILVTQQNVFDRHEQLQIQSAQQSASNENIRRLYALKIESKLREGKTGFLAYRPHSILISVLKSTGANMYHILYQERRASIIWKYVLYVSRSMLHLYVVEPPNKVIVTSKVCCLVVITFSFQTYKYD